MQPHSNFEWTPSKELEGSLGMIAASLKNTRGRQAHENMIYSRQCLPSYRTRGILFLIPSCNFFS